MTSVTSTRPVVLADIDIARQADALATEFAQTAAERDRLGRRADVQVRALSASGLLALRVPERFGGRLVRPSLIIDAARRLAIADPSVAQIVQNHYVPIEVLTHWDYPDRTRARLFDQVLHGAQFATASAPKTAGVITHPSASTALRRDGTRILSGAKFFVTGGFGADWLFVTAEDATDKTRHRLLVPTDRPGVEILDDWDAVGQRGTGSGTVLFHDVVVEPDYYVLSPSPNPTWYGAFTQAIHSAVLVGIARGALDDGLAFVRSRSHGPTGGRSADPFVANGFGALSAKVAAAEALLASAAPVIDDVDALGGHLAPKADFDRAHVAALQARVFGAEVALAAGQQIFEFGGAHAALGETGLDRHWRNARTHSLQRPLTWVEAGLGAYHLQGNAPAFEL